MIKKEMKSRLSKKGREREYLDYKYQLKYDKVLKKHKKAISKLEG